MKKNVIIVTAFLVNVMLLTSSCQKDIDKPAVLSEESTSANNSNNQKNKKKVYVTSLDELYSAVNNPENASVEVVLAPGTYTLNASYPNGGRLELQTDMTLRGQPGNSEAVLIDQSTLPAASYLASAVSTGGVRLGRGTNGLEWLSVKGGTLSVNAFAVIAVDLASAETSIRISHVKVYSNGTRIGIDLRNRLAEHAGRKINADLAHNEITGFTSSLGFALAAFNVNNATGAVIKLNMANNYIHGNKIGLITNNGAFNRTIENGVIEITSQADRLENNGCALDPTGGGNQAATTFANNNTTTIKMFGSTIRNNNPPGVPELQPVNGALAGGVYAVGGFNSVNNIAGYKRASNNKMKLEFYGCDISNNNGADIYAYGAWCFPAAVLAGTNNILDIYLHGISANASVVVTQSEPSEPSGTNVVNVYR
jgi:hypothetical protein